MVSHFNNDGLRHRLAMRLARYGIRLLSLLFLLPLCTGCVGHTNPFIPVTVTHDVVYGRGYVRDDTGQADWKLKDLLLDVYTRPFHTRKPRPGVILVHGGSFVEGSKSNEHIVDCATYLAQQGYVCFSIDYRLESDHPPAPALWNIANLSAVAHAAIVDAKTAVRYVRAHAEEYGVDPARIALVGESAGAVAGVAVAVTDPDAYASDGRNFPVPKENNPGISPRIQAYVHLWGGIDHVLLSIGPHDPPVMIVHGSKDRHLFTTFASSKRFHALLELYGIPHEFYKAKGMGHGAWDYVYHGKTLKRLIRDFLDQYLPRPAE